MTRRSLVVEHLRSLADDDPDAPAVATNHGTVTREALMRRAGAIAAILDALVPADPIGVMASDGAELAACTIACLAVGRPFAPLDPRMGPERLGAVARSIGMRTLFTGAGIRHGLDSGVTVPMGTCPDAPLHAMPVDPDGIAIIGHTSGSTGTPKVRRQSNWELDALVGRRRVGGVRPADTFGMLLGATGGAVRRLAEGLVTAASVVCLDARSSPPPEILLRLRQTGVTYLWIVPTYLRSLLADPDGTDLLPTLRMVAVGAEAIDWSDVALVRSRLSTRATVRHSYGSTETSGVTVNLVHPSSQLGTGRVPAGRPVRGRRIWIRGRTGDPAGPDEEGEVIVELDHVRGGARAERLPDGRVRYATGDLGRVGADGVLTITGRADRRVKIGGVHVDPTEIETLLREHPRVLDAHVIATEGPDRQVCLVAHVHATSTPARELVGVLDRLVRRRIHPSAVPGQIVVHRQDLPRLPSGKVDGMALRESCPAPTRD